MKTLVFFDLEATCWEDDSKLGRSDSEIIEIGAVRVDKESGEIIDIFDKFIQPLQHPMLSNFCTNLTSIKQEDVNNASTFVEVLTEFDNWLKDEDEYIMSWGYYDKNQILRESIRKKFNLASLETKLLNKHLNMKNQFSHIFNIKQCGLAKALTELSLKFEGTPHRGIDDAKNMSKIYKEIKTKFFEKIYFPD